MTVVRRAQAQGPRKELGIGARDQVTQGPIFTCVGKYESAILLIALRDVRLERETCTRSARPLSSPVPPLPVATFPPLFLRKLAHKRHTYTDNYHEEEPLCLGH